MKEARLNEYTSTITDWLHINPLKPMSKPAANPETMQIACDHRPEIVLSSSIPSISRLLPRETRNPSRPAAIAPPVASPKATRQATFLNGTSTVQSHV